MLVTPTEIEDARRLLAGRVLATPTFPAARLSALVGADIAVKYENMQVTGSFKERGAFVKLATLTEAERRRGVITMSAGNHAQAVAFHARRLGMAATIVMPDETPHVKVENTRALGAGVILHGATISEAREKVDALIAQDGKILIHPFDDPAVIAGQGTIAHEMLGDAPDLDVLVVPIGGGGLIAGIAVAAKALKPSIRIIGVEARAYPSCHNALYGTSLPMGGPTLAEGIAVKQVGALTLPIIQALVEAVVLVDEPAIERAVDAYATLQRTMAEGAGAAGLAALLSEPERFRGLRVGLVLCGGNIDARLLASIMVRELERQDRIVSFRMITLDRPGLLGHVATRLGALGGNILEVTHRRTFLQVPAKGVSIDVTLEARDRAHAADIFAALAAEGFAPRRIDASGMLVGEA